MQHGLLREAYSFNSGVYVLRKLKDFFYGFAILPHIKMLSKLKFKEDLSLMTLTIGDMIGLPIMPPLYKLSVLPYWFPKIIRWKKYLLSERGALEKIQDCPSCRASVLSLPY